MNLNTLILFTFSSILMLSCSKKPSASSVKISTPETREARRIQFEEALRQREAELARIRQIEKEAEWKEITISAKAEFKSIESLMSRKCFDCHDATRKLPLYGRIFRRYNPVYRHQRDGLKYLDFSEVFPLKADGQPAQLSMLKAIRGSVIDRSMPIRSYTFVYRSRKIFDNDEAQILDWLDPLIARVTDFNKKYESEVDDGTMKFKAKQIFKKSCFRCHANGSDRGGFGDMQDFEKLLASKYINTGNPEESSLYQQVLSGEMPIRNADRLSEQDVFYVLEWIKEEALK